MKREFSCFTGLSLRPINMLLALAAAAWTVSATDLMIHLPDAPPVTRQTVTYQCDAVGPTIGLPAGAFRAEYISGGGNRLVVVPISGNALIFSNVSSASGARYATQQYTWWDAKGAVTLYSDSITGKLQTSCHVVPQNKM